MRTRPLPLAHTLLLAAPLLWAGAPVRPRAGTTYLYTYYDKNGGVVVNNLPPSYMAGKGLILKQVGVGHVKLAVTKVEMARVLRSPEMLALVDEIATAEGVDPFLVRAVIQAESAFYAKARSHSGALGLMQLMPATAERFGVLDPFDPRQNITGGAKYLKWLMDYYKGDLHKTVAAYNSGEKSVDRYGGIPPFAETRAYVPRVLELFNKHLVQPDPKAAGAMDLLKKGRGGFLVDEKPLPTQESEPVQIAQRIPNPIYQWKDANGRTQISDQPPPKGAFSVRKLGAP